MSSPANQVSMPTPVIPSGEAQKIFAPGDLAWRIENLELTPEGTLRTVVGPCHYEPNRAQYPAAYSAAPHGIFHAGLLGGIADSLICHFGSQLYRHAGWSRNFDSLASGLNDEARPAWPDQFLALGGRIIWTNGLDRAQVISHDGLTVPLGFDIRPEAPQVLCPSPVSSDERYRLFRNSAGYSWPGRIGTLGDILNDEEGKLLPGKWFYFLQYEDIHGNLSPMSARSNRARVHAQSANDGHDVGLDDMLRQFAVEIGGTSSPESGGYNHAVAMRLYRTANVRYAPGSPRFLARISSIRPCLFPDARADGELGSEGEDNVPVPVFRVMSAFQGRLAIGNTPDDPAIVRLSAPGFPGTFPVSSWIYPDSGGAEVTALVSHGSRLLAFTETSVYDISDMQNSSVIVRGVGCVAPRSVAAIRDGSLIWLGRDGFYSLSAGGAVNRVSDAIHRVVTDGLNRGRLQMAVSAIDPVSGEYRCALSPAGQVRNRMILCFDGASWRHMDLGIEINDICTTDDPRRYMLAIGRDLTANQNGVFVLDHEYQDYAPPARTCRYRSGWMKFDGIGETPGDVREIYVGLVDGSDADLTIEFYRDGSWAPVSTVSSLRAVGVESRDGFNSRVVTDIAGSAVIGTSRVHQRRLFWRRVPVKLMNALSWAFEIRATYPTTRFEIGAFAFDVGVATSGNARSRTPLHDAVS